MWKSDKQDGVRAVFDEAEEWGRDELGTVKVGIDIGCQ